MTCVGYPGYRSDELICLWCPGHQRWHFRSEVNNAVELFHDAMADADVSYCERETGIIDSYSGSIVRALLAAGWQPPGKGNGQL